MWATPAGGGLPPIVPVTDAGKALVINAVNLPEWGAEINNATQIIDGGVVI